MEQLPWRCSLLRVLKVERLMRKRGRGCPFRRKRSLYCKGSWLNSLCRLAKQVQQIAHRQVHHSVRLLKQGQQGTEPSSCPLKQMLLWKHSLFGCLEQAEQLRRMFKWLNYKEEPAHLIFLKDLPSVDLLNHCMGTTKIALCGLFTFTVFIIVRLKKKQKTDIFFQSNSQKVRTVHAMINCLQFNLKQFMALKSWYLKYLYWVWTSKHF